MTSKIKLAIKVEESYKRLNKHIPTLAQKTNVSPPDLAISKRHDLDYRRTMELERISIFIEGLANAQMDNQMLHSLISQPKEKWTKQQVIDVVLGVSDG